MSDIAYQTVLPEGWPRPRGFSHAVVARGATQVPIAGQVGVLPGERGEFVFTEEWYDALFGLEAGESLNDDFWAEILTVRGEVNKALEVARGEKRIGGSLQAELTLFAKPELAARLNALADELRFVLLTSKAKVVSVDAAPAEAVATERDDLWLCVAQSAAAGLNADHIAAAALQALGVEASRAVRA